MNKRQTFIVVGVGILAFVAGVSVERYGNQTYTLRHPDYFENDSRYTFINPLLFCQDQNIDTRGANDMEDELAAYISTEKEKGDLIDAAFYFRDLNGGPWALVNPEFRSLPASLLKIPLALSVYIRAEQDPTFLEKKVTMMAGLEANQNEHFKPKESMQPNVVYTVEDAVKLMVQDSDNAALYTIGNLFSQKEVQDSYSHLGIDPPTIQQQDYTMGVKTYASFFRILYNGTYLSQENSEHLLSLLSETTFTQGLVAGLPAGMRVSHKFGEMSSPDGTLQLHDCGIVYKPNQPYLICVMTKGTNWDALQNVIQTISAMTYKELDASNT